jgi:ABC-type branched-subunit amino acid transport system permease subunit
LLKNWMLTLSQSQPVFGLTLKGMEPVVFGLILILVMIVLPQGLVRGLTDIVLASWRTARRAAHRKE